MTTTRNQETANSQVVSNREMVMAAKQEVANNQARRNRTKASNQARRKSNLSSINIET